MAQSVFDRLKKLALSRKEDFNGLLARYSNERFLYRLSKTPHAPKFILKGAMMFVVWLNRQHRPTRDMDLLGLGEISEASLRAVFSDVCRIAVEPDGLTFDPLRIGVEEIRENQIYHGLRIKLGGMLGNARIPIQVDIGVGDAITPAPIEQDYPVLLDLPAPRLQVYPVETVVAEKLDAMLQFGARNSRMKDFYDLWLIGMNFSFDGNLLNLSCERTIARRKTIVAVEPACLTYEFAEDSTKGIQWKAFLRQGHLTDAPDNFPELMRVLTPFIEPIIKAVQSRAMFSLKWQPGGPWL